jgi:hypothetical protein
LEVTDETDPNFVDKPNFIEMTNLYAAIRVLPGGSVDKQYSKAIIAHSLEQLPTYHTDVLSLLVTAIGKLDLTECGDSAATLIDLALRKKVALEKTANMTQTVRAIANLPASAAAERAFATFLEVRNDLEQPQDLEGLDAINHFLLRIVSDVIADPNLSLQAKSLAKLCAGYAMRIVRQKEHLGEATPDEIARLRNTARRVITNFNKI